MPERGFKGLFDPRIRDWLGSADHIFLVEEAKKAGTSVTSLIVSILDRFDSSIGRFLEAVCSDQLPYLRIITGLKSSSTMEILSILIRALDLGIKSIVEHSPDRLPFSLDQSSRSRTF